MAICDVVFGIGNRAKGLTRKVGCYFRGVGRGLTSAVIPPRNALLATLVSVMIGGPGLEARVAAYDPAPKKPVEPVAKKIPYGSSNNKPAAQATADITALGWNDIIAQIGNRSNTRDEILQKVNWIMANVDPNRVYYTAPGESASTTQNGINDPTKTIVYWRPGTYEDFASINDCYSLKPNKIYILDGTTIRGLKGGMEHWKVFRIAEGGPVIVLGINDAKVENFKDIAYIGNSQFDDILFEGLDWNFYRYGTWMDNVKGSFSKSPVVLNLCEFIGGNESRKAVMFDDLFQKIDANSPYAGGYNLVLRNIKSDAAIWDVPIYYKEILTMSERGEWVALGNDEISGIITEDCSSFSLPNNIWIYNSPNDVAQKDLIDGATALVTGETYYDWNSNPHVFDGKNCFVADSNDFYKDTLQPIMFGRLHKQDGTYIADLEPVATMWSVGYFCNCWLAQGDPHNPDDPNNDSNYDGRVDFDKNWIINFIDFANVAEKYRSEGEPISKATVPSDGEQYGDRQFAKNTPKVLVIVYQNIAPHYSNFSGEMIERLTSNNGDTEKQIAKDTANNGQVRQKNYKPNINDLLRQEQPYTTMQNRRFAKYNERQPINTFNHKTHYRMG